MLGGSSFPPKLKYFCLLLGVRNAGTEPPLCDGVVVVAGALLGRAPGKHGYVGGAVAVKPFYPPRLRLLQVLERAAAPPAYRLDSGGSRLHADGQQSSL